MMMIWCRLPWCSVPGEPVEWSYWPPGHRSCAFLDRTCWRFGPPLLVPRPDKKMSFFCITCAWHAAGYICQSIFFFITFFHKLFFSVGIEYQFADYTGICTNTHCTHRRHTCITCFASGYMVSNSHLPDNTSLYTVDVPVLRRHNTWSRTPVCPHHSMPWVQ